MPLVVLARMVVNLLVDTVLGFIPFLGDMFDLFSKANAQNLALFRRYALEPEASTSEHRLFFVGLGAILLGLLWLAWQALGWLIGLLTTPHPAVGTRVPSGPRTPNDRPVPKNRTVIKPLVS